MPFLLAVYASTRADEMKLVPWSDEQKLAFLEMQCQAQHQDYLSRYPNASYDVISLGKQPVGRLYVDSSGDEIKILDITILPEYRKRGAGAKLISEILQKGASERKPVQIYVETFNPSASLFSRLGFRAVREEGFYHLWQWNPAESAANLQQTPAISA